VKSRTHWKYARAAVVRRACTGAIFNGGALPIVDVQKAACPRQVPGGMITVAVITEIASSTLDARTADDCNSTGGR